MGVPPWDQYRHWRILAVPSFKVWARKPHSMAKNSTHISELDRIMKEGYEMERYRIAVVPGDGIGVDTINEAEETLKTVCAVHGGIGLSFERYPWVADIICNTGR